MTLRAGIAIFVKTPEHSSLKTRLAQGIGRRAAERFHLLSAQAVAAVVRSACSQLSDCAPHWAVAEAAALDDPNWASMQRIGQGEGDLGARMRNVTDALLTQYGGAVLLGADTPQVTADDLIAAVQALDTHDHAIGPSIDGGFWLFATRGGVPTQAWATTPWSREDTAARFCIALVDASIAHLRDLRDVDLAHDLQPLLVELDSLANRLPEQTALAEWLRSLEL